jgi:hypothetical protein
MQITMTRFSGKTLTANRNVDALPCVDPREHQTPALWFLPTFLVPTELIASVTGHPVLYDPSLSHFSDRNKKALAWAEVSRVVGWSVWCVS